MNQLDLKGRVAVVTGGARGIGYAVAERVLRSGGSVALWDRDAERLESAVASLTSAVTSSDVVAVGFLGAAIGGFAVELTSEEGIDAAVRETLSRFQKIDILVNNAGITGGNAPMWELAPSVWRGVIEVNLIAPFLVCRAIVPHMLARGYGRIVNVASIAGKEGNPNASHYSASKAGLIGLTKSLGKELATKGILVNCVTPAAARTEIFDQMKPEHIGYMLSKIPMSRFVEPEELAALIGWLVSEDCSFSTGAVFDASGGRGTY